MKKIVYFLVLFLTTKAYGQKFNPILGPWQGTMAMYVKYGYYAYRHSNYVEHTERPFPGSLDIEYVNPSDIRVFGGFDTNSTDSSDGFRVDMDWTLSPARITPVHAVVRNVERTVVIEGVDPCFHACSGFAIIKVDRSEGSDVRLEVYPDASRRNVFNKVDIPINDDRLTGVALTEKSTFVIYGGSYDPSLGNASIEVKLEPQDTVEFLRVDDSDPNSPIIHFDLMCDECEVKTRFAETQSQQIGTLKRGSHSFQLSDIRSFPPGEHKLEMWVQSIHTSNSPLYIHPSDNRRNGRRPAGYNFTTINTSLKGKRSDSTSPTMNIPKRAIVGPRLTTQIADLDLYYHEWDLPGAKFDRWIEKPGSSLCISRMPQFPYQHFAGSRIVLHNGVGQTEEVVASKTNENILHTGLNYCASFLVERGAFMKSQAGKVVAKFSGTTTGGPPGVARWFMWPGWPEVNID